VGEERRRGPISASDRRDLRGAAEVEFQSILSRGSPELDEAFRNAIARLGLTAQMIRDRAYWSTIDQTEKLNRIAFQADQQRVALIREIERRRTALEERRRPTPAGQVSGRGFSGRT